MKNIILLLLIAISFTACDSDTISSEEVIEEEIDELPKEVPNNFKLLEQSVESFKPHNTNQNLIVKDITSREYTYDENGKLKESELNNVNKYYTLNEDGSIGPEKIYSYYIRIKATYSFFYENNKINHINLLQTQTTTRGFENDLYFEYDENDKLIVYEKFNTSNTFQLNYVKYEYTHSDDLIYSTYYSNFLHEGKAKDTIQLNSHGNFKKVLNRDYKYTYDNKNKPSDLIYPKYMMGYVHYGSGNVLSVTSDNYSQTYSYIYNEFDLPIEVTGFNAEDGTSVTIKYTYGYL